MDKNNNKRSELKMKVFIVFVFLSIFNFCLAGNTCESERILKPVRLKKNDKVLLFAPGFQITEKDVEVSQKRIESLGLKGEYSDSILESYGYFAGTDEGRVSEINRGFNDTEINALFAVRGGYGSVLLLDKIDYDLIKNNPKVIMGYSDVTALLIAIYKKTGLVTFHGPLAKLRWSDFTIKNVKRVLFDGERITFSNSIEVPGRGDLIQVDNPITTINGGKVEGRILGGNLATLDSMIGSEYFPENWEGVILFLEEVGDSSYSIDRMLAKLKNAGVLSKISGFIFGTCSGCKTKIEGNSGFRVDEVLKRHIEPLNIPAFSGAMIGHQDDIFVIPIGLLVEMDADQGTITLLEDPVS